jgi:hypothetical protein
MFGIFYGSDLLQMRSRVYKRLAMQIDYLRESIQLIDGGTFLLCAAQVLERPVMTAYLKRPYRTRKTLDNITVIKARGSHMLNSLLNYFI